MADFTPVAAEADLPEDGKLAVAAGGWHLLLVKVDGGYHAVNDRCPHAGSPLSGGRVRRGAIMCPLHGARFDLASGACLGGPYPALRRFDVRVAGGMIEVAVPAVAPGADDLPVHPG